MPVLNSNVTTQLAQKLTDEIRIGLGSNAPAYDMHLKHLVFLVERLEKLAHSNVTIGPFIATGKK